MSRVRFLLLPLVALLAACSTVQPWERGELADPSMAWVSDPMRASLDSHVFESKEASRGSVALSGGGCGCN